MCGIAGYLNCSVSSFPVNKDHLENMQRAIAHRGPDDYDTWISPNHQLGLVHRRLSILDLSAAGKQPMMDREQTVVISYNGEIYNNPELRKELEALGYTYSSNTDTETILYAYKEWGIDCIKRFDGMFAIALYDLKKDELYLIRDRIGIKPLYFSVQGDVLSFASEIKALWPLPWIKKELNPQGLYHYLTYLVTPAPMTLYKGVYKLPASFYIKVDTQRNITFHEWYSPLVPAITYSKKELNDEQFCIDRLRSLLRASVKKHMLADVPVGAFLSGGIDSSLNVALMSEISDKVQTFNVSFSDGPEFSEVEWARKVAQQFNTEHHELVISEKEAFSFFEKMVHHQDEPLADCVCIPFYYVAKLIRDSGVKVAQIGEGSDELFCGYSSYARYLDINNYWQPSQALLPAPIRRGIYTTLHTVFPNKTVRLEPIKNWADGKNLFWSGAAIFSEERKKGLYLAQDVAQEDPVIAKIYQGLQQSTDSYSIVDYHLRQVKKYDPNADFLKSMIYLEFKQRLPELLLMRADKMAMATSVEGRVPFLDHHVVEFAFQIPTYLKYKNGVTKYILKKACEGILPHDVIYRKKVGFAAPTKRWFKEGSYFKPYFKDLLKTKHATMAPYLSRETIEALYTQNQRVDWDNSIELWILQNVLATDVL
jgi:asparagine synthase (glutamine-hydrolysing)